MYTYVYMYMYLVFSACTVCVCAQHQPWANFDVFIDIVWPGGVGRLFEYI